MMREVVIVVLFDAVVAMAQISPPDLSKNADNTRQDFRAESRTDIDYTEILKSKNINLFDKRQMVARAGKEGRIDVLAPLVLEHTSELGLSAAEALSQQPLLTQARIWREWLMTDSHWDWLYGPWHGDDSIRHTTKVSYMARGLKPALGDVAPENWLTTEQRAQLIRRISEEILHDPVPIALGIQKELSLRWQASQEQKMALAQLRQKWLAGSVVAGVLLLLTGWITGRWSGRRMTPRSSKPPPVSE